MKNKKILVINGHPSKESLSEALANAYTQSAMYSGANVRRINIRDLKFDNVLHEGYKKEQSLEEDLKKAQNDIVWAEHVVFFYPIWWGTMPALMKGFIDRVFVPGFAFKFDKPSVFPQERFMKEKSVRVITTAGGPKWVYLLTMNPPYIMFKLYFLMFCGFGPTRNTNFCSIREDLSVKRAKKIFGKVKRLGNKGI